MYLTEVLCDIQTGVFIFIVYLMKGVSSHGKQPDNSECKLMVMTWRPQQGLVVHTPRLSEHPFPCKWKPLSERSQRKNLCVCGGGGGVSDFPRFYGFI